MTVQDGSEKEDLAADLSDYSQKEEPGGSVGVGTPAGQNARRLAFFGLAALIVAAAVAVVRLSGTPLFRERFHRLGRAKGQLRDRPPHG